MHVALLCANQHAPDTHTFVNHCADFLSYAATHLGSYLREVWRVTHISHLFTLNPTPPLEISFQVVVL